ncbi:PD40 domain-containing protein [Streptosporangium fragile]|uniref:PD40 domain-containing protein n=1 Tax=Streptosporangium fragile TaxID=46186 RepID=A0ABP6I5K9_9ACTN
MTPARRLAVLILAVTVLGGTAAGYTAWAGMRAPARAGKDTPARAGKDAGAVRPGRLVFRTEAGRIAGVPLTDTSAEPTVSGLTCNRFSTAAGTSICLAARPGPVAMTDAVIYDRSMRETRRIDLAGIPNRARVSGSGRMASWTVFVTGDSYNAGGFSTWTGILDTRTGYLVTNMEDIPLTLGGRRHHAVDVNYWGVTFAPDDNRFYATVSTKGKTYLVEGDYGAWRARTIRENAECPSLSPDGTRLVFKKRVSGDADRPWRLHLLDLATMRETPLAETESVDDQAVWLDERTVAYAREGNVWSVPADGSGTPVLLVRGASSPVAVR